MADVKEYAYYIEGSKISLVERDVSFDNDPNSKDMDQVLISMYGNLH